MLYYVEIGKSIVYLRQKRGITQEQLALEANVSISYLRALEHDLANPSIEILDRLARVLEIPLPMLLLVSFTDAELTDMLQVLKTNRENS